MTKIVMKKSALRALIREMLDNNVPIQSNPILGVDKELGDKIQDQQIEPKRKEVEEE